MIDYLVSLVESWQLSHMALLIIGVMMLFLLVRIMRDKDNDLEWYQFISTRNIEGKNVADIDKLGKVVGIIISSWVIVKLANMGKLDATMLLVYLGFVGAVATYSAYLRSRGNNPPSTPGTEDKVQ